MREPSSKHEPVDIRRVQADGSVLLRGPNLRVRVAVLKAGVVLASADGEVLDAKDQTVEAAVLEELEKEMRRAGTLTLFADLRNSPRVPAPSREKLAEWAKRHRARMLASHVLVQSKLMEMAVSIVSMLIGQRVFEVYTRPAAFLRLLQKVAPKLTELPTVPER
ncbi:MAG: hypothetical protein M3020_01460 [Myxococcota bacterium]|nr:hypothetical protein [Myxococcota bacterium]